MVRKPIWLFGGIAGVSSAFLEYLFYSGGDSASPTTLYISKIAIGAICVIFGLILAKKLSGGIISIGSTILTGLSIEFVKGLILFASFALLSYPDGSFYQAHEDKAVAMAKELVMNNADIALEDKEANIIEAQDRARLAFTPMGYGIQAVGGSLVTGLVISVLMAAFIATNMMFKDLGMQSDEGVQEQDR